MTFLPIVARELRVSSRRKGNYWSRSIAALSTIVLGMLVYSDASRRPAPEMGEELFMVLSVLAFIYCLGVGVRSTADCLSEEKREGTLGLLFLTDLKGYDVVVGKLVATSLNAFYGLMAIFPVMAIPLLMGGITQGEFWRAALVLADTFLFSLSLGMWISSISKSPRKAMVATLSLILIISVGLPLWQSWWGVLRHSPELNFALALINPDVPFGLIRDAAYTANPGQFWWPVGAIHGASWLLLGTASWIVPRSWQDRPAGEKSVRWRERWKHWMYGEPEENRAYRKRLLDTNAFYWLAARARLKPAHVWATLIAMGCLWCWGAAENGNEWLNPGVYFVTIIIVNTTLKIWVASEAGRQLGEDRKIGALELILSTPLSVREILQGQLLALKRQFFGPVVFVLVMNGVLMIANWKGNRSDFDELSAVMLVTLSIMIMLVADSLALTAVSMWGSLTARNPNRVTGLALRRILVLPWGVMLAVMITRAAVGWREPGIKFFLALYFFTGIFIDLWFGLNAWRRLNSEFRDVAAKRFIVPASTWQKWFAKEPEARAPQQPVSASVP